MREVIRLHVHIINQGWPGGVVEYQNTCTRNKPSNIPKIILKLM